MKNTRWIAHKRLLAAADEIKKAERRITYTLGDISALVSSGHRTHNPSSSASDKALLSLNKKLISEQEKKAVLSDKFLSLVACVPFPSDETLILYYLKGLSVTEIAIKRDLSEGTVKNHLSYGRDLIYEKFNHPLSRHSATAPLDEGEP